VIATRLIMSGVVLWAAAVTSASAQVWAGSDVPHRGSWEISGGAAWSSGFDLGDRAAQETRNPGTGSGVFNLFETSSRVGSATGGHARVGAYLSRSLAVEAGVQYLRPVVSTRISGDFEEAVDLTATETLTRYVFDGSLVLHIDGLKFAGGRGVPFIMGGGGYVRELHTRNELIETGSEVHAGTGFKLWFGRGARRFGVRADVGVSRRNGGFDFSDGNRTLPIAGASLVYLF